MLIARSPQVSCKCTHCDPFSSSSHSFICSGSVLLKICSVDKYTVFRVWVCWFGFFGGAVVVVFSFGLIWFFWGGGWEGDHLFPFLSREIFE